MGLLEDAKNAGMITQRHREVAPAPGTPGATLEALLIEVRSLGNCDSFSLITRMATIGACHRGHPTPLDARPY
jgi:hypothetical protein